MYKALNGEIKEQKPETVPAQVGHPHSSVTGSPLLPSLDKASRV